MKNPFQYGAIVTGEAFCNRREELSELVRSMTDAEKLFVYSERRFGKTSLVRVALDKLPRSRIVSAYVDLWPTDDEISFATAMAKAVTEATETTAKRMLEIAGAFFGRLSPSVTLNDAGKPQIEFGVRRVTDPTAELEEVLAAPAKIAAKKKRGLVVVFDEFQQILEYNTDMVERQLRSVVQHQSDVSYIFLGSRKHLIQQMFLDKSRPLYRAAGHYPLRPIGTKHWQPFIRKRFVDADRAITSEHAQAICELTQGHPFYTQHLCHTLWDMVEKGGAVTHELIHEAVDVLLGRESYAYTTLWESLTKNQQRLLRGLASEPEGVKPFASEFTRRYGLRSASNAQRAVEATLERDIIDRENGSFLVVDRFFRIWIERLTRQ